MAKIDETLKDYANKSRDALMSFSAKAGERLQDASETLIQTIDTRRLRKRLQSLHAELGLLVWEYQRDEKRLSLKAKPFDTIIAEITRITDELEGRANLKEAENE